LAVNQTNQNKPRGAAICGPPWLLRGYGNSEVGEDKLHNYIKHAATVQIRTRGMLTQQKAKARQFSSLTLQTAALHGAMLME
jgi:hypothetical protein